MTRDDLKHHYAGHVLSGLIARQGFSDEDKALCREALAVAGTMLRLLDDERAARPRPGFMGREVYDPRRPG